MQISMSLITPHTLLEQMFCTSGSGLQIFESRGVCTLGERIVNYSKLNTADHRVLASTEVQ